MLIVENHIGKITISEKYLADLIGYTVSGCFGVADMNECGFFRSFAASLTHLKHKPRINKGVSIRTKDNKLIIDLHITVAYGTNISVITESITGKVKFAVEEATGTAVSKLNVFIDNMND